MLTLTGMSQGGANIKEVWFYGVPPKSPTGFASLNFESLISSVDRMQEVKECCSYKHQITSKKKIDKIIALSKNRGDTVKLKYPDLKMGFYIKYVDGTEFKIGMGSATWQNIVYNEYGSQTYQPNPDLYRMALKELPFLRRIGLKLKK